MSTHSFFIYLIVIKMIFEIYTSFLYFGSLIILLITFLNKE